MYLSEYIFHLEASGQFTHIQSAPSFFGTTTMPAHHGVGSSTLEMTPRDSIRSSSSWTLGRLGSGTCMSGGIQGVRYCFWLEVNLVVFTYIPESLEYCGELFHDICLGFQSWSGESVSVVSTQMANPRAVMAGRPRRFVLRPSTTNTHCLASFPLCENFTQNCPRVFGGCREGP